MELDVLQLRNLVRVLEGMPVDEEEPVEFMRAPSGHPAVLIGGRLRLVAVGPVWRPT